MSYERFPTGGGENSFVAQLDPSKEIIRRCSVPSDGRLREEIEGILEAVFFEVYQSSGLVTSDEQIEEIADKILTATKRMPR